MYLGKNKDFILNYSKLPKVNTKKKVVISFVYSPDNIKPFVNSILNQTVKVDNIYMILPHKYIDIELPQYLNDIAYVIKSGKEYNGEHQQKIIPMLQKETECDTVIISMNKHFIYGYDFIENIVNYSERLNNDLLRKNNFIIMDEISGTFLFYPGSYSCEIYELGKKMVFDYPNNIKY